MLNRVVLIGRLTRDPEMKYTPQGVAVAQMGIAVNRFTKNDQGEYETDFFNIVAWRRSAEFAANYLTKGRLVSVDGRLQTRSWVAQDGTKRTAFEIVAENIQGLDRPPQDAASSTESGGSGHARGGSYAGAAARPSASTAPADDVADDVDPFADE